jgi:hypothetical protein
MTPGYYSAKAITALRTAQEKGGIFRLTASLLDASNKMIAPPWALIFDREDDRESMAEYIYLPYSVIAIEFPSPATPWMRPDCDPAPKRIALGLNVSAIYQLAAMAAQTDPKAIDWNRLRESYPEQSITVMSIYETSQGFWHLSPISVTLDPTVWVAPNKPQVSARWIDPQRYGEEPPPVEALEQLLPDMTDEIYAVIDSCIVLNMPPHPDGPVLETIEAPHKLNKKRAKQNKPLLSEYKVVDCYVPWSRLPKHARQHMAAMDKRQGVRRHKVRRFKRTLPSGKWTWVREHWRGNPEKGTVTRGFVIHNESE